MDLETAIRAVLSAAYDCRPVPANVLAHLREEVDGPFQLWGVQTVHSVDPDAEHLVFSTRAARDAWLEGVAWADGFDDPQTFYSYQDALDHIEEGDPCA